MALSRSRMLDNTSLLVAQHSGRTLVFDRRALPVLRSTGS